MNRILPFKIIAFIALFTFISCSKDSDEPEQIEKNVLTQDFSTTMDENPTNGQLIGTISGTTNQGTVTFSVIEQSPEDAFSIDSSTGELKVAEASIFNFEINPTITGTIKVANETLFEIATVTINLNDLEEDRPFQGDVFLRSQSEINDFGNLGYTRIIGNLNIGNYDYDDIVDLTPLLNLEKIDDYLSIYNCSQLATINGLRNLSHIGSNFLIIANPSLKKIHDLQSLTSIEGTLDISLSLQLTDISGFNSLESIGNEMLIDQIGLANLDDFENLKAIGGNLNISYCANLKNIDGLSNLENIGPTLSIISNDILINLNGFANLTDTVLELKVSGNHILQNISGLQNIDVSENISISDNSLLKNIDGLSRISSLSSVTLLKNNSLKNIDGLSNLNTISNDIKITRNKSLSNLNALTGLTRVDGLMEISQNLLLRDFCGLQNFMTSGTLGSYEISDNLFNPTKQDIIDGNCSI
ncbi:cadherin repeat domain-containing protein [Aequorivita capsosiphonis]|uniref:cadherin repeat domain-containing protein n=1 Tax=Aequorivita capsosiphonis TaxID=487317 RepID=UPI0003F79B0D|nr:cadherin repeat domain-containing protein [Aequorivita capsosiphonis]